MRLSWPFLALAFPLLLSAQTPEVSPEPSPVEAEPIAAAPVAPPAPEAQPGAETQGAILLIYRQKRFAGAILNTSVFVDDVEIADLDNGTYLKVKVTPGEHAIRADEKKDAMVLPVEPGKTYYFRMALRAGLWKGHGKLEPVDAVTGEKEFTEWKPKLVYAKDIRKPEMVVQD